MALFLASVRDEREAKIALAGGAGILDLKDPAAGALGAVDANVSRRIMSAAGGAVPISVTIGDVPLQPELLEAPLERAAALRPDFIKIGLFGGDIADCLPVFSAHAAGGPHLIAVFFADKCGGTAEGRETLYNMMGALAEAGFRGVMVDTAVKSSGSLLFHWTVDFCSFFVRQARSMGLACGLAGGLRAEDIAALLPAEPDILGFRGALCAGQRNCGIDPSCVQQIRNLIPRNPATDVRVGGILGRRNHLLREEIASDSRS